MVLLAEGERYRDQLWPLVIHLRVHNQPVNPPFDGAHRFVWSADSRHLLLLTTGARAPGLAVLPNGEQAYLLFDTVLWEGVIVPGMQDVTRIRFPGLSIAGQPANISR